MSPSDSSATGALSGRRIVVPETRSLTLFTDMLERRGAVVLRCPLVKIVDSDDVVTINQWIDRCCAGQLDDLVLLTGEGLRRLNGFAQRAGREADFHAALAQVRSVSRGPKPGKALRDIGLRSSIVAPTPTTDGVIAALTKLGEDGALENHRIGLQFYGDRTIEPLQQCVDSLGAIADPVWPYRYEDAIDDQDVHSMIEQIAAGDVDAIAFTSAPQVRRLFSVAREHRLQNELTDGLGKVTVAAVGPVVAESLSDENIPVDVMPESFFMKPLVNALASHFSDQ